MAEVPRWVCSIQSITDLGDEIKGSKLIVGSGSEYTWIPEEELKKAGITVRKRDVPSIMANGQVVTRDVGYAILRCQEFETVDEVEGLIAD